MPLENTQQADQKGLVQAEQQGESDNADTTEIYKVISGQMLNLLYDSSESIIETLRTGGQEQSATILARIMVMSINSLKMAGKRVEPGMMLMAMVELSKALGELAIKAGVMDEDPRMIEESFFAAIGRADEELQDEALSQKDRASYAALMNQLRTLQQTSEQQSTGQPQPEVQPQPQEVVA
jgi:hypothetical protein